MPVGASNCCNSARIYKLASASNPRAVPRYRARVRASALAQNEMHMMSNKALNVHDMVTLRQHYIYVMTNPTENLSHEFGNRAWSPEGFQGSLFDHWMRGD
jgi:hypothetical protein